MSIFDQNITLKEKDIMLKRLTPNIKSALANVAQDERIWLHTRMALFSPDIFEKQWFDKALAQMEEKTRLPLVIYWKERLVGSSSYYDIQPDKQSIFIGYTWYHPDCWGTSLNPSIKYMMLCFAFDTLQFKQVFFSVDQENLRSCKALEKLGIKQQNIIENHMIRADGSKRNSVIFSVLKEDFPEIAQHIKNRIKNEGN